MSEEGSVLTEEEKQAIDKDLADARTKLVSQDTEDKIRKAKEEGAEAAKVEIEKQQEVDAIKKENADLKASVETKEKEAASNIEMLTKKVDDLVSSKAPVEVKDPFAEENREKTVNKLSDDEVNNIEERSAREFFGDGYDDR